MSAIGKRVTLSFDNGPFEDVTPGVLDTLAARDLRASFFVCGRDLHDPRRRALVERARDAGHRIGNHTLTHTVELGATDDPDAPRREIGDAQELLGPLAAPERWFRPYGAGGMLGPRLLSRDAVRISVRAATRACSGTACRATGKTPTAGRRAPSPTSRGSTGRWSSCTTSRPARCGRCLASSTRSPSARSRWSPSCRPPAYRFAAGSLALPIDGLVAS